MIRTVLLAVGMALAVGGCASVSYDGHDLVPGKSTGAEVEALMGKPAARIEKPDGTAVLYFTRSAMGRQIYAVTLGRDGVMRGIEQTLTQANVDKLVAGTTTATQVRELLGPPDPALMTHLSRQQFDVWEYHWANGVERRVLWVHFSKDGILREVINTPEGRDDPRRGP